MLESSFVSKKFTDFFVTHVLAGKNAWPKEIDPSEVPVTAWLSSQGCLSAQEVETLSSHVAAFHDVIERMVTKHGSQTIEEAIFSRSCENTDETLQAKTMIKAEPAEIRGELTQASSLLNVYRLATQSFDEIRGEDAQTPGSCRIGQTTLDLRSKEGLVAEAAGLCLGNQDQEEGRRQEREKYTLREVIGRGGMGEVVKAFDHDLGRFVAIKRTVIKPERDTDEKLQALLLAEARLTGQLDHPNIVPVHEVALSGGESYYAMKYVSGRSLQEIIQGLKAGSPDVAEFTLHRLLQIFCQVCQAVHFAHESGVIHRDLKPANIMVGRYGEVFVMDWGLARLIEKAENNMSTLAGRILAFREAQGITETASGSIKGTPAYIAPEQAFGENDRLDARTDVFLLGATLYEILCGVPPYEGKSLGEILTKAQRGEIRKPSERAPQQNIPPVLEEMVMKAMALKPQERFQSAKRVFEAIQEFLDGSKEKAFRAAQSEALVEEAKKVKCEFEEMVAALKEKRALVEKRRDEVQGWEPIEKKRPVWEAEDEVKALEEKCAHLFSELEAKYQSALSFDAGCKSACEGLADLHFEQFILAEKRRKRADQVYHESRVKHYHDGKYEALLKGDGVLELDSEPQGAEVIVYRYEEIDRRLTPVAEKRLGKTPLSRMTLEMGSYLVILKKEGFRDVRYPVSIRRSGRWEGKVKLYRDKEIGEGFIYVPGGPCIVGGDEEAFESLPAMEVFVTDFFIARFPVTFGEYLEFVNDLEKKDPEEARRRVPRDWQDGILCEKNPVGLWIPIYDIQFKGEILQRYPRREGHEFQVPVSSVSWHDDFEYAKWRSTRDGVTYRLPTELEWEKAARGVDGRFFPWGDHFDPTFCKMRNSRPEQSQPEPVGVFEKDVSPYGVRDMGGGIRQWTSSVYKCSRLSEEDPSEVASDLYRVFRGCGWSGLVGYCRSALRSNSPAGIRNGNLGFRLLKTAGGDAI